MKTKIINIVIIVLALGILAYDLFAGERVDLWIVACVVLIVAAQLYTIFHKQKTE